jgi:hypothetical protein
MSAFPCMQLMLQVKPKINLHNLDEYVSLVAEKQRITEERRMQARMARAAAEMQECTFHPVTHPLPAYILHDSQEMGGYTAQFLGERMPAMSSSGGGGWLGTGDEAMADMQHW